jgi:hypothetical protein
MFKYADPILSEFDNCFSYRATYYWFLVIISGFIIRFDHNGVSSFVRYLFLEPKQYDLLLHFFRTDSWCLTVLTGQWVSVALNRFPATEFNGRILLIGDGIKVSKEAKKMPGVKKLRQESENSGKGEYIFGHYFNFVGILTGCARKLFCLPLQGRIHEGIDGVRPDEGIGKYQASVVTRMARLIVQTSLVTGRLCYVAVDRYFATAPMFLILKESVNEKGEQIVHVITRAKKNYVGYFDRLFAEKRFDKEDKVPLTDRFDYPELFETVRLNICGQIKEVECFCINLLWSPIKDFVRFVCVKDGDREYILMCSDLTLPVNHIITGYIYRSKIETMFLTLKHLLGGFCYHFWTEVWPEPDPGEHLNFSELTQYQQEKITRAINPVERFVNLACISLGILEYICLTHASEIWEKYAGWLRTRSSEIPSEGVAQSVMQVEFFMSLHKVPNSETLRILQQKRRKYLIIGDLPYQAAA